jgi:FkbM family methyltransferase
MSGEKMRLRFLYRALKARFRDQKQEISALLQAIHPGDTVVDIGANKGSYLWWLSKAVGVGRVVAFEPQKQLADYLAEACRACKMKNVIIEPLAVSERSGETVLNIPGETASPEASIESVITLHEKCRQEKVKMVSLDDYFADEKSRISAIKMDVEGHELSVFRGAIKVLLKHSPLLVFECENRHQRGGGAVTDVLGYLADIGYQGFFVKDNLLLPLKEFNPDVHQRQEGSRYWDSKDYCNNFVMSKDSTQ